MWWVHLRSVTAWLFARLGDKPCGQSERCVGYPCACDSTMQPRRRCPCVDLAKLIECWRRVGRQLLRSFTVTLRTTHPRRRGQPCCQYGDYRGPCVPPSIAEISLYNLERNPRRPKPRCGSLERPSRSWRGWVLASTYLCRSIDRAGTIPLPCHHQCPLYTFPLNSIDKLMRNFRVCLPLAW